MSQNALTRSNPKFFKYDAALAAGFDPSQFRNLETHNPHGLHERAKILDKENRILQIAFASDQPIEHWFGFLKLKMTKKAVRADRINNGLCPHLVNHDRNQLVGVNLPKTLELGKDGKARLNVKFSRNPGPMEIFQDIEDEIRNGISFGFLVHNMYLVSKSSDEPPIYESDDWEVFETTTEAIPADINTGHGRSLADNLYRAGDKGNVDLAEEIKLLRERLDEIEPSEIVKPGAAVTRENPQTEKPKMDKTAEQIAAEAAALEASRNAAPAVSPEIAAVQAATVRSNAFQEHAATFGTTEAQKEAFREIARTAALDPAKTISELNKDILEARGNVVTEIQRADPQAIATREGVKVEVTTRKLRLRSFKGENAQKEAYRFGMYMLSMNTEAGTIRERAQKYCRENGIALTRDQSERVNELGGYLVPDEFENIMIDLRLEYGIFRANANVVPMSTETKSRPRRVGGLTAFPVGAGEAIGKSNMQWDRVNLTAKKWGVLAKYESELAEDAIIDIGDELMSEISYAFTKSEDECGFNGTGTAAYHGILGVIPKLKGLGTVANTAGIQVASGNTFASVTTADLLGVIGRLPSFARKSGQIKFFVSQEVWANVIVRVALAAGGNAYENIAGKLVPTLFGYPVEITEVMPHVATASDIILLFGNLSQAAMFGDRRGISLRMTDSNDDDFEHDLMSIRGTERFDINVHDVGNNSATAASRLAGGVVALQLGA